MRKSDWTLVLDGEPYEEGSPDEGVDFAKILVPPEGSKGAFLGFTDRDQFKKWARSQRLAKGLDRMFEALDNERGRAKRLTDRQQAALAEQQAAEVAKATRKTRKIFREHGVRPDDVAGVEKLHDQGFLGTQFLYADRVWRGAMLQLVGVSYPKLSWFSHAGRSWNDEAESAHNTGGLWTVLCQHTWWGGAQFWIPPPSPFSTRNRVYDLGWFRNRASSVFHQV